MDVRKMLRGELITDVDIKRLNKLGGLRARKVYYNTETGKRTSKELGEEWLLVRVGAMHKCGPVEVDLRKVEGGYRWAGRDDAGRSPR